MFKVLLASSSSVVLVIMAWHYSSLPASQQITAPLRVRPLWMNNSECMYSAASNTWIHTYIFSIHSQQRIKLDHHDSITVTIVALLCSPVINLPPYHLESLKSQVTLVVMFHYCPTVNVQCSTIHSTIFHSLIGHYIKAFRIEHLPIISQHISKVFSSSFSANCSVIYPMITIL